MIDLNRPHDDIVFELCMGRISVPYGNIDDPEIEQTEQLHRDLMAKYDLQRFSTQLYIYQKIWFRRKKSLKKLNEGIIDTYEKELQYKLKISKILKMFLLDKKSNNNLTISFMNLTDKVVLEDSDLSSISMDLFLNEFKRLKLNETQCTWGESIVEIQKCEDPDWLGEFASLEPIVGELISPSLIPEDIIENYSFVHYKEREVTLDLVNNVIDELEQALNSKKSIPGAKIKNLEIGDLAKRLSYLHQMGKFLKDEEQNSINIFPLSNETCRFIYQYLDFWGLLNDQVRFDEEEKEKRTNYIKSLIRNFKNYSKDNLKKIIPGTGIRDSHLETRIDLYKMVTRSKISPQEFQDRIQSLRLESEKPP